MILAKCVFVRKGSVGKGLELMRVSGRLTEVTSGDIDSLPELWAAFVKADVMDHD